MSLLQGLREMLADRVTALETLGHHMSWQSLARAGAATVELEHELIKLGLPLEPLEAATEALVNVAGVIHSHVSSQAEQASQATQDELREQIAALTAQLDPAPEPADPPATPTPTRKQRGQ